MNRRDFLQHSAWLAAGASLFPQVLMAQAEAAEERLIILHTNDVHSRLEPFPMDGGKLQGQGGVARRAALIERIRQENRHVLLIDAGDMFQGTPYFNYFQGEIEIRLMSQLGYEAGTLGNHDFDGGIENLRKQLDKEAKFPIVCANYEFKDTPMAGKAKRSVIIQKGPLKIGILGLGVELQGLVPKPLYLDTQYLDPIAEANKEAKFLRHEAKCDLVIALSHLGYSYQTDKVSDCVLAKSSEDIDLIIGGHTHTFLDQATRLQNAKGREVLVSQAGWAGAMLGYVELVFDRKKGRPQTQAKSKNIHIWAWP